MNFYIVTGGSKGLGKAIVLNLLGKGQRVINISRSPSEISNKDFDNFACDLTDPNSIDSTLTGVFNLINKNTGIESIHLINNAAVIEPIGPQHKLNSDQCVKHFELNLIAPFLLTGGFVRQTSMFGGRKSIINISTGAADRPIKGLSAYCTSKAAMKMYTECLKAELAPGYSVADYDPGVIDTDMQQRMRTTAVQDFPDRETFRKYKDEGKLLSPAEGARQFVDHFFSDL